MWFTFLYVYVVLFLLLSAMNRMFATDDVRGDCMNSYAVLLMRKYRFHFTNNVLVISGCEEERWGGEGSSHNF